MIPTLSMHTFGILIFLFYIYIYIYFISWRLITLQYCSAFFFKIEDEQFGERWTELVILNLS